ncbi:MAG: hypothetical protein GF400_05850, partial [Candidatus Eisenbacteria bacterium]|nr:hypothetical protein [Candidatus Eisenbacteria bacterium]
MSEQLTQRRGNPPDQLAAAVESGRLGGLVLLQATGELPKLAVVRPLVEDMDGSWVAAVAAAADPAPRSLLGVVSSDPRLAASVASAYASWAGDRGYETLLVDGSLESPSIDKPLLEDGDEGLVDALRFGVSPESVARRTLARGVRVVTAGSLPVSIEKTLDPAAVRSFVEALGPDIAFIVLPDHLLPSVGGALDVVLVSEEDPDVLVDTARAAGEAGIAAIVGVHVVGTERTEPERHGAAATGREIRYGAQEEARRTGQPEPEETPPEEPEEEAVRAEPPAPGRTTPEARRQVEPSPFLPEEREPVTAAPPHPVRRRSRAGIATALVAALVVAGFWFTIGPGGGWWEDRAATEGGEPRVVEREARREDGRTVAGDVRSGQEREQPGAADATGRQEERGPEA